MVLTSYIRFFIHIMFDLITLKSKLRSFVIKLLKNQLYFILKILINIIYYSNNIIDSG